MNFAQPLSAATLVSAAVRVVLPWSMCPMVPTFTCGLLRSNFSLAMSQRSSRCSFVCRHSGADDQDRTGDLVLTKDALCQLSYIGHVSSLFGATTFCRWLSACAAEARLTLRRILERETGIEPATNSLEGCDSTTELLPPSRLTCSLSLAASAGQSAAFYIAWSRRYSAASRSPLAIGRAKVGGEGRTRTFEAARATDLQSAAFDRFATSPTAVCVETRLCSVVTCDRRSSVRWSWRRDSNPRPADYKSAALPD